MAKGLITRTTSSLIIAVTSLIMTVTSLIMTVASLITTREWFAMMIPVDIRALTKVEHRDITYLPMKVALSVRSPGMLRNISRS